MPNDSEGTKGISKSQNQDQRKPSKRNTVALFKKQGSIRKKPSQTTPEDSQYDFVTLRKYLDYGIVSKLAPSPLLNQSIYHNRTLKICPYKTKTLDERFMYYHPSAGVIKATDLKTLQRGESDLESMIRNGDFWIDVLSPTTSEMKILAKVFGIHPVIVQEILVDRGREKCEFYRNYTFTCFRGLASEVQDEFSSRPVSIYFLLFKDGLLTVHFQPTYFQTNLPRKLVKISHLKDYSSEWIHYTIVYDLIRAFSPFYFQIEKESEQIDDAILLGQAIDLNSMLKKIAFTRNYILTLLKLSDPKITTLTILMKKSLESHQKKLSLMYNDLQDDLLTLVQNLNHLEVLLAQSHSSYLASLSVHIAENSLVTNTVIKNFSVLAFILVPVASILPLWNLNVPVPGQIDDDFSTGNLTWFFSIVFSIFGLVTIITLICRKLNYI